MDFNARKLCQTLKMAAKSIASRKLLLLALAQRNGVLLYFAIFEYQYGRPQTTLHTTCTDAPTDACLSCVFIFKNFMSVFVKF